ncbi:MAG TPA: hypothetical protein VI197_24545 [Polyangiaceae bacterium]
MAALFAIIPTAPLACVELLLEEIALQPLDTLTPVALAPPTPPAPTLPLVTAAVVDPFAPPPLDTLDAGPETVLAPPKLPASAPPLRPGSGLQATAPWSSSTHAMLGCQRGARARNLNVARVPVPKSWVPK